MNNQTLDKEKNIRVNLFSAEQFITEDEHKLSLSSSLLITCLSICVLSAATLTFSMIFYQSMVYNGLSEGVFLFPQTIEILRSCFFELSKPHSVQLLSPTSLFQGSLFKGLAQPFVIPVWHNILALTLGLFVELCKLAKVCRLAPMTDKNFENIDRWINTLKAGRIAPLSHLFNAVKHACVLDSRYDDPLSEHYAPYSPSQHVYFAVVLNSMIYGAAFYVSPALFTWVTSSADLLHWTKILAGYTLTGLGLGLLSHSNFMVPKEKVFRARSDELLAPQETAEVSSSCSKDFTRLSFAAIMTVAAWGVAVAQV